MRAELCLQAKSSARGGEEARARTASSKRERRPQRRQRVEVDLEFTPRAPPLAPATARLEPCICKLGDCCAGATGAAIAAALLAPRGEGPLPEMPETRVPRVPASCVSCRHGPARSTLQARGMPLPVSVLDESYGGVCSLWI